MVRINKSTWITATTYGSVFTIITSDQQLNRIYLDNEATEHLCSNDPDFVLHELKRKQIDLDGFIKYKSCFKKEKSLCDSLALKNEWKLFSLYPLQISAQTLNYCNARCDFCYANAPNEQLRTVMDVTILKTLKDYAAENGVKFGVSGGEPLLHPQLFDILSYRNDEVFDTLITNLTPNINLDRLIQTKVDLIQVSIHGYDKIHDRLLGINNAYQNVFDRMRYLHQSLQIATNTVITPDNIFSLSGFVNDLQGLQEETNKPLTYVRFVPVVPSGTGNEKYGIEASFFDESEKTLRTLMKKYPTLNFEIPMIHANPYEYRNINDGWMCPAGSTVAVVRLDGHVVPCNQFLDTKVQSIKNLKESSFHDIWLNDPLFSTLRQGKTATKSNNCQECIYLMMKTQDKIQNR